MLEFELYSDIHPLTYARLTIIHLSYPNDWTASPPEIFHKDLHLIFHTKLYGMNFSRHQYVVEVLMSAYFSNYQLYSMEHFFLSN